MDDGTVALLYQSCNDLGVKRPIVFASDFVTAPIELKIVASALMTCCQNWLEEKRST